MTAPRPRETHYLIQYLRAVAAAAVVFNHGSYEVVAAAGRPSFLGSHPEVIALGACGVDVFFVISGFIIFFTMTRETGLAQAGRFLRNRFVRVVPLYWLWTSVLAAAILAGLALKTFNLDAATAITSYLMIPHEAVPGKYYPILLPGWTLSFEMYFYAVAALLIALVPYGSRLAGLLAVLAAVQGATWAGPGPEAIRQWLAAPLVYEFVAGAGIAVAARSDRFRALAGAHRGLGLALIALGAGCLAATALVHDAARWRPLWAIPSAMLVAGAVLANRPPRNPATRLLFRLGTASYSLYLTHFLATSALGGLMKRGHLLDLDPDLLAIGSTLVIVAACSATYAVVERPLLGVLRRGGPAPGARAVAAARLTVGAVREGRAGTGRAPPGPITRNAGRR